MTTEDTESTERATPETDAAQCEGLLRTNPIPMQVVTANFARELERERDAIFDCCAHMGDFVAYLICGNDQDSPDAALKVAAALKRWDENK